MARPLFEQYKDALRRGHVALLNDELEPALAAYREAAALVPDRPLPYASIAGVLERLGRPAEAVAAYDASLALAPDDAAVVAARAALAASLPSVAAPAPPAVEAPVPPAADAPLPTEERPPAAEVPIAPAARSQPEIVSAAEPPPPDPEAEARRAAANAAAAAAEAAAAAADAAALDAMRAALEPRAEGEPDGAGDDGEIAAPHAQPASPSTESSPAGDPSEPSYYVDRAPVVVMDEERNWPAIDLPSLPPEPFVGPPPDPATLQADADALVDRGDTAGARDALLLAVAVHREAGRLDAALDAGLQVLAVAPGDPQVHLAIANLQLDRGWRSVATEKIELLLRLTSLSGDSQAEADVHLLAADRLRDEDPARLDARRRGVPTA